MKKLFIVHGTLGAGKSTLVSNIINKIDKDRTVIVENEFASDGIDSTYFQNIEVREINGQCVCCSTGDDLKSALHDISHINAIENVIIETSGVSSLLGLLGKLFALEEFIQNFELAHTFMLIDPTRINRDLVDREFQVNLILSDTVLVNKSDLIKSNDSNALIKNLKKYNPNVFLTKNSNLSKDLDINELKSDTEDKFFENIEEVNSIGQIHSDIDYIVLKPNEETSIKELEDTTKKHKDYIERVKGYIVERGNTYSVNYASQSWSIEKSFEKQTPKLVFIGKSLKDINDLKIL